MRKVGANLKRVSVWLSALILSAGIAVQAEAGPKKSPDQFLTEFGDQAIKLLSSNTADADQRSEGLRNLLAKHFDVDFISRTVLARHWRKASDDERTEFRQLFEDYIVSVYGRRLGNYSGEHFQIGKIVRKGDDQAYVSSKIVRPAGPPVKVAWRLRGRDGKWRIVDIVVEGVSMAMTQRSEFGAVIRREGGNVSGLNAKLRELAGGRAKLVKKVAAKAS
ncbi:MAG: toluene tolerance protein [Rhodospirillaceae bacterium]|jgi:phospholipid transport system substrate-binding protein|nr:toluene tolerance protein [Rhodospirillaceae bacterium]|tara:strand:- start:939 stop:1598 length:660 start_codon:yes stop_codon:yes gene_type:complete